MQVCSKKYFLSLEKHTGLCILGGKKSFLLYFLFLFMEGELQIALKFLNLLWTTLTVKGWGELGHLIERKCCFETNVVCFFISPGIYHKYSQILSFICKTAKIYCINILHHFLNIWIVLHTYYHKNVKGTVLCVTLMDAVIARRKQGKKLVF